MDSVCNFWTYNRGQWQGAPESHPLVASRRGPDLLYETPTGTVGISEISDDDRQEYGYRFIAEVEIALDAGFDGQTVLVRDQPSLHQLLRELGAYRQAN